MSKIILAVKSQKRFDIEAISALLSPCVGNNPHPPPHPNTPNTPTHPHPPPPTYPHPPPPTYPHPPTHTHTHTPHTHTHTPHPTMLWDKTFWLQCYIRTIFWVWAWDQRHPGLQVPPVRQNIWPHNVTNISRWRFSGDLVEWWICQQMSWLLFASDRHFMNWTDDDDDRQIHL